MIIKGTQKADYKAKKYHIISGAKGVLISIVTSIIFGLILYYTKKYAAAFK
jgi:hypothetical protein